MITKTRRPFAVLAGWLLGSAAMVSAILAQDGANWSPDMNLFGGDLPPQEGGDGRSRTPANKTTVAKEGYGQTLIFQDGRELRGEVVEITGEQVIWKRPDASEPLRFTRAEVRRIVTEAVVQTGQNFFARAFGNQRGSPARPSDKPAPATLKLSGGDWLFGEVTSANGETFAMQLGENSPLTIPRARIEWLQYGDAPVPAFGFSGSTLDMEGWLPGNATRELVGGTLVVKGANWIGCPIARTERFEISFELPAEAEEGTRLWLQPFGPQPNCYGPGTAEIRFGKKEISRMLFLDKFVRLKSQLPKESLEEEGPVKYRVFYSEADKRVAVLRNGRPVGDWTYLENKDPDGNAAAAQKFHLTGICFDREGQGPNELKFNQLRILPWDGALPKQDAEEQDRFTGKSGPPIRGKLESLSEKDAVFSGATLKTEAGAFIQFPGPQNTTFRDAEAKLDLGQQGEFSARHLAVREGKVHCETSFASALDLPLEGLQRLTFPQQPSPSPAGADTIVFQNGDELSGKVLSAALPGPVRWRTAIGQEVTFESNRIAGLRLGGASAAPEDKKAEDGAATVELRSGERLAGKLLALDEKQLRLEHARLGPLALDRSQLWHLFPNSRMKGSDGMLGLGGWKWTDPGAKVENRPGKTIETAHWVHLDGTYFVRNDGNVTVFDASSMPGLEYAIGADLERFEFRVETRGLAGGSGNFLMILKGRNTTSLNATLSYGELQAVVIDPHGRQPNWREIPLQEKLGENSGPRAVRFFVDTMAGSCDIVINGVHIVRLGHEKNERLLKGQYTVRLVPYPNQASILSNIWVGPWSGEIPHAETASAGATALTNGDVAPGLPKGLREGKLAVDSELGELNFPLEKALALDFGGTIASQRAAARLRLTDGTTVNVDTFRWDGNELTAHSVTWGDLRLSGDAVQEIIYDPALPCPPLSVTPKALAQKRAESHAPPEK